MNLAAAEQEILEHKDARKERARNEELIKKLLYDVIKVQGDAVIKKAVSDLTRDFEKGL